MRGRPLLALALAWYCCAPAVIQAEPPASHPVRQAEILHHNLEVKLMPDRHGLLAIDQLTVRALADDLQEAVFTLHGNL